MRESRGSQGLPQEGRKLSLTKKSKKSLGGGGAPWPRSFLGEVIASPKLENLPQSLFTTVQKRGGGSPTEACLPRLLSQQGHLEGL